MMVSINQRLDAETLSVIAEEYGFKVEFVGADVQENLTEESDDPERVAATATDRHRHGSRGPW
jgi:translation initiation factor IF-2